MKPRKLARNFSDARPHYAQGLARLWLAPRTEIDWRKGDAENIGRNKAELGGAKSDHAHDRAVDGCEPQSSQQRFPSKRVEAIVRMQET